MRGGSTASGAPMYPYEFDFKASHRPVSDAERFCALMMQTAGSLL